jgi:Skp family chaperone for outer membrane proteins
MKLLRFSAVAAALFLAVPVFPQSLKDIIKIGIVDMKKLFDEYASKSSAAVALREKKEIYAKEIRAGLRDVKSMEERLRQRGGMMTSSEKRRRIAEIQYKKEELANLIAARNLQLEKDEEGLTGPILQEIYNAIRAVAGVQGIKIVLNSQAQIAYHDSDLDITELVLRRLRMQILRDRRN